MILLLLVACGTVHTPTCTSTTEDVPDDAVIEAWGVTAESLYAPVIGAREVGLRDEDGGTHPSTLGLTRGAASATFTTVTYGDKETPSDTIGDLYLTIAVHCPGGLTVPVDVDLASDDATVGLTAPAPLAFTDLAETAQPADATAALSADDTLPSGSAEGGGLTLAFVGDRLDRLQVYEAGGDTVLTWP